MSDFRKKNIVSSQTLGDRLKRVRQEQALSLEEISKRLKISQSYLVFLETGEYNKLPSPVYIKNYLKKYASFLQLNWKTIASMYEREMIIYKEKENKKISTKFSQKALVIPKIIYGLLIIFIGLALVLYLLFEISNFIQPPQLTINNLPDQLTIRGYTINIEGNVDVNAQLFINGQEVVTDENGNFNEEVSLQTGLNTIKIMAKKKHSKERVMDKQIFVEQ